MFLFIRPEITVCWFWVRARFKRALSSRWREARGQAVFEYFLLFLIMGMLGAVVYRYASPIIERIIVNVANKLIASNVAGEN